MRNTLSLFLFFIIYYGFGCNDDSSTPSVRQYYSQVVHQLYTIVDVDKAQQMLIEGDKKFSDDEFWQARSKRIRKYAD